MKLAEALGQRADLQKRLAHVKQRALGNVLRQEGDAPAEDPNELIAEFEREASALESLIRRINLTNLQTRMPDGRSLTAALAERDVLRHRYAIYNEVAQQGSQMQTRQTRSEIRMVAQVDVAALRRRADELARDYRTLDSTIQALNWATDLVEE